jgi:hypothetical protein
MSVLTLEGMVEGGRVRLLEEAAFPDKTKVYVVVPGAQQQMSRIGSPGLAEPEDASQFKMEVTELREVRARLLTLSPGAPR